MTDTMERAGRAKAQVFACRGEFASTAGQLATTIHALAEPSGHEEASRDAILAALEPLACTTESGLGDWPTGLIARTGSSGGPGFGIIAEYDALPGVGHACGHNLIAGAAYLAFAILSRVADDCGIRVVLFGTPAEEDGMAKIDLAESGVFDEVGALLMCHPAPVGCDDPQLAAFARWSAALENTCLSAHPGAGHTGGGDPFAAEALLRTNLQFATSRLPADCTVTAERRATTGTASVRPSRLDLDIIARGRSVSDLVDAESILRTALYAAAGVVGVEASFDRAHPMAPPLHSNPTLLQAWSRNRGLLSMRSCPMSLPVATDLAVISQRIPTVHPFFDIGSRPHLNHDAGFSVAAATPQAMDAMVRAGTAMALTVIDVASQQQSSQQEPQ
ncbi:M20/M25/M40 family metallo-hydrolase [Rudaeicoccus suwonensis]|uniref:Metal-dependent amidase/aminoacylase/carboxypeptidase family protein n=1 Tax=Rudaeicoccus suwonensis TaxID=657409 RepID=A0A561ECR7_9MICO|nr:M20/M25/M40 family metallo-hydrolase [Rudaeicoccus suwonensis]TWE13400.1 metal-dependent amidase/aminoacylase/carboxypeptidase family protein [Rudaeicoccus suwonensis]